MAFNLRERKWIDFLSLSTSKKTGFGFYPLRMFASDIAFGPPSSATTTAIVVGDFGPVSRLIIADLDEEFAAFSVVQTIDMSSSNVNIPPFQMSLDQGTRTKEDSPLLLASDTSQHTVVVGNQSSRQVSVYQRGLRSIELRGDRTVSAEPVDISVAPDGSGMAILTKGGNQIELSKLDAGVSASGAPSLERSQVIQAQRALSRLGFPVGLVDGIIGPQTVRAIAVFQKGAGLSETGVLDAATIGALNSRVPSLPICAAAGASFSAVLFYRNNRARDATVLKAALADAGLGAVAVASDLTEVHLDQEYPGTTYVIPSNRLGDKESALEDCVMKVAESSLPANLASEPPLRRGGHGDIHRGDIAIYLY